LSYEVFLESRDLGSLTFGVHTCHIFDFDLTRQALSDLSYLWVYSPIV